MLIILQIIWKLLSLIIGLETKTKLADSVVAIINNHYKTNYTNELKRYSTIELGFFQTLKNAVATGDCDIVTTQTQPIVERAQFVHFQCGFGLASKGWVRTGKDPQIVIQNVSDLNNNGILVGGEFLTFQIWFHSHLTSTFYFQ